jgi:DNA-binding transcriptional regulator YiaG
MEYTEQILDRTTGELVTISKGDWMTITELGELHGIGSRKFRVVLRKLDFLQLEYVGKTWRHRLAPWVTERGWGKRLQRSAKGSYIPFDVVGPDAREWIKQRLPSVLAKIEAEVSPEIELARAALDDFRTSRNEYRARLTDGKEMSVEEMVLWLSDHFPKLSQPEVATLLNVTQQLVSAYQDKRWKSLRLAKARRKSRPGPITKAALSMVVCCSSRQIT